MRGGGGGLLEESPPDPRPQGAFGLPTPRESQIPCLIFTPLGVEKQVKNFCDGFFVAAAPRLDHLIPPHLAIPCLHKPPKHNVAVPINKVEGRLRGANPVRGGVGVAHHPIRGARKVFGAEGSFTRNEGGGAQGTTVPLQRTCNVDGGVGDFGDMHLWGDGGMERGNAQILPPPGAGKVPGEGEKEWSHGAPVARSCRHTMSQLGGVYTRLVVGYTWTWASLGFPTGLVCMELSSWSMVAG